MYNFREHARLLKFEYIISYIYFRLFFHMKIYPVSLNFFNVMSKKLVSWRSSVFVFTVVDYVMEVLGIMKGLWIKNKYIDRQKLVCVLLSIIKRLFLSGFYSGIYSSFFITGRPHTNFLGSYPPAVFARQGKVSRGFLKGDKHFISSI